MDCYKQELIIGKSLTLGIRDWICGKHQRNELQYHLTCIFYPSLHSTVASRLGVYDCCVCSC